MNEQQLNEKSGLVLPIFLFQNAAVNVNNTDRSMSPGMIKMWKTLAAKCDDGVVIMMMTKNEQQ